MKQFLKGLTLLGMVACQLSIASAGATDLWNRTYNGPGNAIDESTGVAVLNDHKVVIIGTSYTNSQSYDWSVVAYKPDGTFAWEAHYQGDMSGDIAQRIQGLANGNVVVTGTTTTLTNPEVLTICYSADGKELWQRHDKLPSFGAYHIKLAVDADSQVYLAYGDAGDYRIRKLTPSGAQIWTQTVSSGPNEDTPTDIQVSQVGDVFVTGTFGEVQGGYGTVRLNKDGVEIWKKLDTGPIGNTLGDAHCRPDNQSNVWVASNPESTFGVPIGRVTLYGPAGQVMLSRDSTGAPTHDFGLVGAGMDQNNNFYVCGYSISDQKFMTTAFRADKNLAFETSVAASGAAVAGADFKVDPWGRTYLTGFISPNGNGSKVLTFSLDASGKKLWQRQSSAGYGSGIALDGKNRAYVSATSGIDFLLLAYQLTPDLAKVSP